MRLKPNPISIRVRASRPPVTVYSPSLGRLLVGRIEGEAGHTQPMPRSFRILIVGGIAHAAFVLILWVGMMRAELQILSGPEWLAFAWFWLWPIAIVLHPARRLWRVAVPIVAGAALLVPCARTIYTFTAWSINGFAP